MMEEIKIKLADEQVVAIIAGILLSNEHTVPGLCIYAQKEEAIKEAQEILQLAKTL